MTVDDDRTPARARPAHVTPRLRNLRGEGQRLREEILDAAIALIDETDEASSLTLRGIARRANISAPSIYPHFADRQAIIDAVLERSFDELCRTVEAAALAETDPASALVAAGGAYVQFGWTHKARYRLMFAPDGYATNAVDTFNLVEATLQRCVDEGLSTSIDPHHDAWLMWAALHGVSTLPKPARADYLRLGPLDRPALVAEMVRRTTRLRGD